MDDIDALHLVLSEIKCNLPSVQSPPKRQLAAWASIIERALRLIDQERATAAEDRTRISSIRAFLDTHNSWRPR